MTHEQLFDFAKSTWAASRGPEGVQQSIDNITSVQRRAILALADGAKAQGREAANMELVLFAMSAPHLVMDSIGAEPVIQLIALNRVMEDLLEKFREDPKVQEWMQQQTLEALAELSGAGDGGTVQ